MIRTKIVNSIAEVDLDGIRQPMIAIYDHHSEEAYRGSDAGGSAGNGCRSRDDQSDKGCGIRIWESQEAQE